MRTFLVCLLLSMPQHSIQASEPQMTAKKFDVNDNTEEVIASEPRFAISGLGTIQAKRSTFRVDNEKLSRVMDLDDVRVMQQNLLLVHAKKAVLFPQLRALSASQFSVERLSTTSTHSYTCHNGQLRDNGVPVSGNKACFNSSAGGSINFSCNGNEVQMIWLDQQCPIE